MASRRMLSRSITSSARFLKLPFSTQALYMHLVLSGDDDGVCEAYTILKLCSASEEDLYLLEDKGFIKILNDDFVVYIIDWLEQNQIRPDRKQDSIYQDLLKCIMPDVVLIEKRTRSDLKRKSGLSMGGPLTEQGSVVNESKDKDKGVKASIVNICDNTNNVYVSLDKEILTYTEYKQLVQSYPKDMIDGMISRILDVPYHGCLNVKTISKWCIEKTGQNPFSNASSEAAWDDQLTMFVNERQEYNL